MPVQVAIIGGTGVYVPGMLEEVYREVISTSYGKVPMHIGKCQDKEVAFLNRHGEGHSVPPHLVNYRANISALKTLGVKYILATAAVGSLNPLMKPGDFVFIDQFLDFTKSRQGTFFESRELEVIHQDMTEPYCSKLRELLARVARVLRFPFHSKGVYVCTEGPRFETTAEIRMYSQMGGDLVGMTGVPEIVLAREAEICYATIAMVTNFAAGMSPGRLNHQEVVQMMKQNEENVRQLIKQAIGWLEAEQICSCHQAPGDDLEF